MMPDRNQILSYEEEQRIRALLADSAGADGLQTPERVELALVAGLRRRNRVIALRRIAAAGALAAAVLIVLIANRPKPAEELHAPAAAVIPKAPPPVVPSEAKEQLAAVQRPIRRARPARPRPRPAEVPVESNEFIPVGAWQAFEPMERGSIIRVRMPKSALPEFGIPVSADRWNESIPADVVLGEDGTIRAVRFVSTRQ